MKNPLKHASVPRFARRLVHRTASIVWFVLAVGVQFFPRDVSDITGAIIIRTCELDMMSLSANDRALPRIISDLKKHYSSMIMYFDCERLTLWVLTDKVVTGIL